jgi:catechol 2,3-dioxygenase-like lactoylglutathione lyase family enzyme
MPSTETNFTSDMELFVPKPLELGSPSHVVVGVSDLDASIDWWTGLGFGVTSENTLDPDAAEGLFGLAGEVEQVELRVDEAPGGAIWLVQTPHLQSTHGPFEAGPYALSLYTTDMDASLALGNDLGAKLGGRLAYSVGNLVLEEGSIFGPDGSLLVFIASSDRDPSVLDIHPEWLHSEIHSIVSNVRSVDTTNRFWSDQVGMTILADRNLNSGLGSLPKFSHEISTRTTSLCDEFINPIRYVFVEFNDDAQYPNTQNGSTWPLPAACPLGCFSVVDVATSAAQMFRAGATFGEIVELGYGCAIGGSKAIWGLDPNGTRFILAGN